MNVLVTGAVGFIGAHLCRALVDAGLTVTGLDMRHPRDPVEGVHYVLGDVGDSGLMDDLISRHDAVAHLACVVGYAHVMAAIEPAVQTTTVGTSHVVRACLRHRTSLLFTSTSAVYGHGSQTDRVQNGAKETDPLRLGPTTVPSWAYAYAKAAAECQVLAAGREHGLPVTVVRLFNVVGPGQSASAGFVLPRFVAAALRHETLHVYTPGSQTRTFGHVADVVQGLVTCLTTGAAVGEVVNLGGTTTVSVTALADRVIRALDSRSRWRLIAPPYQGYEEIRERRPDLTKARHLLGYRPSRTLEDMIRDTAEAVAPEVLV
jgi:UDP-glucose 4-epimerase